VEATAAGVGALCFAYPAEAKPGASSSEGTRMKKHANA
jgi:hypothetical protein